MKKRVLCMSIAAAYGCVRPAMVALILVKGPRYGIVS